jgi:CRISPR/Cas system-associated endonuclease Cas1
VVFAILRAGQVTEARLALEAVGLDPGLGFLHLDTNTRDSLACDLMEPVRLQVNAVALDWITRTPINREWFFEERNGNCRLIAGLAAQLSDTIPKCREAVAPLAEQVVGML